MRRLAIAGIIAMKPESSCWMNPLQLDPQGSENISGSGEVNREGMTVLMVEHRSKKSLLTPIKSYCALHAGKLIAFDKPSRFLPRRSGDYGLSPVFTRVCKELNIKTADGLFPVTLEEAYDKVVEILA